jgi:hypothetical protein
MPLTSGRLTARVLWLTLCSALTQETAPTVNTARSATAATGTNRRTHGDTIARQTLITRIRARRRIGAARKATLDAARAALGLPRGTSYGNALVAARFRAGCHRKQRQQEKQRLWTPLASLDSMHGHIIPQRVQRLYTRCVGSTLTDSRMQPAAREVAALREPCRRGAWYRNLASTCRSATLCV